MQRTKSTKRAKGKRGVIKEKAVYKETKQSAITDVSLGLVEPIVKLIKKFLGLGAS